MISRITWSRRWSLWLVYGCIGLAMGTGCTPQPESTPNKPLGTSSTSGAKLGATSSDAPSGAASNPSKASPTNTADRASTALQFSHHGEDLGIRFQYQNGEGLWLAAMIESNGGGVGWIDYDRDGRADLFFPGGGQLTPEKLPVMVDNGMFRQLPQAAGAKPQVADVGAPSGSAAGVCYSYGAAVADYDNDGFPDVFITGYAGQQLLRNQGDGTFEDATALAGFHHRGWSSSAAWFDLENDGDLDLYIAHYGVWSPALDKRCFNGQGEIDRCAPADFVGEADELWVNRGDGTFEDRSSTIEKYLHRGVGVVACDFDMDGDTDLYVANDEDPKVFFDNLGGGLLNEIGAASGTSLGSRSIVDGSMGLAVGDFDGNLKPDVMVTNYQNEYCELYLNQGKQYFSLGTRSAGLMALGQAVVGWGTAFLDVDHDRDEDVVVIAGHTSRRPIRSTNLQKPYLLLNQNGKRLQSIGESVGEFFRTVHAGRGMAIGDLDRDGDVDFAVSMLEQPVQIVLNDSEKLGRYVLIDLVGTQSSRDALGAWIELDLGGEKRIKHKIGGGSYASTHAPTLHVGLGDAQKVQAVTVHWPSGQVQTLRDVESNRHWIVVESGDVAQLP
ncbi:MAG: CRTAC1 family protein [Pirellula sp.]